MTAAPAFVRDHARKTQPGPQLGLALAVLAVERGEYLYIRDKPMHPEWVKRMQLDTFLCLARNGRLRMALDQDGKPYRAEVTP